MEVEYCAEIYANVLSCCIKSENNILLILDFFTRHICFKFFLVPLHRGNCFQAYHIKTHY